MPYIIEPIYEFFNHNATMDRITAKAIRVAQTTYSDYEKGKDFIPLECLMELARLYSV